jgi:hypothetical protein
MGSQLTTVVLLAAISSGSMYAAEETHPAVYESDVYLSDRDGSSEFLKPGKRLASIIFAKIGVHLHWHVGELPATLSDACVTPIQKVIGVRTLEHAPESAARDALASARIVGSTGTEITVYRDRLQGFLDGHSKLAGVAGVGIGYVLTHELAHVMQGVARHSEFGILKAQWSNGDFEEMIFIKLAFTNLDVVLIHRGLALQLANVAAIGCHDAAHSHVHGDRRHEHAPLEPRRNPASGLRIPRSEPPRSC